MHLRNIMITTLVLAVIISTAFTVFPQLTHFDALGIFYFPSILLSVIFSGGSHMPSALAGWSSFLVYTLFYWAVLFIGYALILEIYLFSKVLHHLDDAKKHMTTGEPNAKMALERLGMAIKEVETSRRKHFFLKNIDMIDLSGTPREIAKTAISKAATIGPIRKLLRHLESNLQSELGKDQAAKLMAKLHVDAQLGSAENPGN